MPAPPTPALRNSTSSQSFPPIKLTSTTPGLLLLPCALVRPPSPPSWGLFLILLHRELLAQSHRLLIQPKRRRVPALCLHHRHQPPPPRQLSLHLCRESLKDQCLAPSLALHSRSQMGNLIEPLPDSLASFLLRRNVIVLLLLLRQPRLVRRIRPKRRRRLRGLHREGRQVPPAPNMPVTKRLACASARGDQSQWSPFELVNCTKASPACSLLLLCIHQRLELLHLAVFSHSSLDYRLTDRQRYSQ